MPLQIFIIDRFFFQCLEKKFTAKRLLLILLILAWPTKGKDYVFIFQFIGAHLLITLIIVEDDTSTKMLVLKCEKCPSQGDIDYHRFSPYLGTTDSINFLSQWLRQRSEKLSRRPNQKEGSLWLCPDRNTNLRTLSEPEKRRGRDNRCWPGTGSGSTLGLGPVAKLHRAVGSGARRTPERVTEPVRGRRRRWRRWLRPAISASPRCRGRCKWGSCSECSKLWWKKGNL